MVKAKGLSKSFESFQINNSGYNVKRLESFRLNNINFELPSGYILGLIGANGAGKTTLLRVLASLYKQSEGLYDIGCDISDVACVFQEDWFDGYLSLVQNASRYGAFYISYDQQILHNYLTKFDLMPKMKYSKLSKGEKLKFSLAFALSHQPKLLLLDEPSANFDTDFRREFHVILRELVDSGNTTIILSTHLMDDVERYADYVLMIDNGNQILYNDIETIRESYRMVAGPGESIKLLRDRVIHIKAGEYSTKALVKHEDRDYKGALKVWRPSLEEIMYHYVKLRQEK